MKLKYNNDWIKINQNTGIKYFPTRFKVAEYVTEDTIVESLDNISLPNPKEFIVNLISEKIDFSKLMQSKMFNFIDTKTIFFDKILKKVKETAPIDDVEIVEWMQECGAINAMLDAMCEEYNQHSHIEARSGDANLPGVSLRDIRFNQEPGWDVYNRGYAIVITPYSKEHIKNHSGKSIIFKDFISWGAVLAHKTFQYNGILAKWIELAKATINKAINKPIRFISFFNITSPQFVVQDPEKKVETTKNIIKLTSTDKQTVTIRFRDPIDYRIVLDEGKIKVEKGQFEIIYGCAAYPYVPPVVVEIQPEKPSTLDAFYIK